MKSQDYQDTMKNKKSFNAGIVQFDVKLGDVESNIKSALDGLHILGTGNVDIAVLPEMWSCGFDNQKLSVYAEKTPVIIDRLSEIASRYNMIIAGSLPESSGENIFNTMYVVDGNGSIVGSYRKIHLFSLTEENRYFCAGTKAVVCETSIGTMGLMICYDLRFPELCRSLTLSNALVVIVSAQWPDSRIIHWDLLTRVRAIENQIFIIAANRCGKEGNIKYGGHSQIVSPTGDILAMAKNRECALNAELDLYELSEFRNKIPCLKERVPCAYVL